MTSDAKRNAFVEWCREQQDQLYARMYDKAREELDEESVEVDTPNRKRSRTTPKEEEPTAWQYKVGYFTDLMIKWGQFKTTENNSIVISAALPEFKTMLKEFGLKNLNQGPYTQYKKYITNKEEWDAKAELLHLDHWIEELHKKRPMWRPKEFAGQDEEVHELKYDQEHFQKMTTKADTFKNYTLEADGVLKSKQFPEYTIVLFHPYGSDDDVNDK